ncbi:MAG: hypothetical protein GY787_02690 [Alteromonadales bacterium]|nr:hypothetical protein [Alteromonadales bacterium]
MTQDLETLLPRLDRLELAAKRDKSLQFNNLMHHINIVFLQKAFYQLNKKAAKDVDELSWHEYEKDLLGRVKDLPSRLQSGSYKAQPVKRLWISKRDGQQRPIGVTAIEDKIVQQAVV